VNVSSAAEGRRLDFGNRSRRQLVAVQQVKHAANGKERRAHMVRRRNNSNSNSNGNDSRSSSRGRRNNSSSSRSSGSAAPHPAQASAGKGRGAASRRVERDNQKKRHRQRHDNFLGMTAAAPEEELRSRRFLGRDRCCRASVSDASRLSIHHQQNLFDMAIVSNARPNRLVLDFLECSSIFCELIPMFEEDDQSRLAAIAIFRVHCTIR
jgi:hypothetical protein